MRAIITSIIILLIIQILIEQTVKAQCHIDDWTALKALYESTDGDNWTNRTVWDSMIVGLNSPPANCNLEDLYGVSLNSNGRVYDLSLNNNNLKGNIPSAIGNLIELSYLNLFQNHIIGVIPRAIGNLTLLNTINLNQNKLSGNIPYELGDLRYLFSLNVANNNLSGPFRFLSGITFIDIVNNYFTYDEIVNSYSSVSSLSDKFSPQRFGNITNIKLDEIETLELSSLFEPYDLTDGNFVDYLWKKNNSTIKVNQFDPTLEITNSSEYLGKYTLRLYAYLGSLRLDFISDPIYVTQPGKDLYSKPVELEEVIVEFDNDKSRIKYEKEILKTYNGFVKDSCACNRKIYLWEFHKDSVANVLIEIDAKKERIVRKPKIDGGPNNIFKLGNNFNNNVAWTWAKNNSENEFYKDSVSIYLIDTGLDEINWNPDAYLKHPAPIESCFDISSSGYNFTDTLVNTNYKDNHGHGTFGFRSITDSLPQLLNLKVVPIKAFNSGGEGRLFDLICALYHSIDNQANIINISAGYSGQPSTIFERALQYAHQKGIFITTAAGNDGVNIDSIPQYPAFYAGQYYKIYNEPDSLKYDNIISVAAINAQNELSPMSSYGKSSVTLAAYGENMMGFGLNCKSEVSTGTSISTYYVSRALAMEIAENGERDYKTIWQDFEKQHLVENKATTNYTITGKILNGELIKHELFSNENKLISIYPNPTSDYLHFDKINTNKNWKAEIYNLDGALVLSRALHCNVPAIKIKSLSSSTYIVNLFKNNEIYQTAIFVKQ